MGEFLNVAAGVSEVFFNQLVADRFGGKTSWRRMPRTINMPAQRATLMTKVREKQRKLSFSSARSKECYCFLFAFPFFFSYLGTRTRKNLFGGLREAFSLSFPVFSSSSALSPP